MPGPYRSGYVIARNKRNRYTKRTKSVYKRPMASSRRRLTALIRRTVVKATEPKAKYVGVTKTDLYHNCFYNATGISSGLVIHLNNAANMPAQGTGDNQRVGDQIMTTGYKVKMLLGQQADRPNVNWRYFFVSVPKGSTISYGNWFKATTNNVLLDDINTDYIKVHRTGVWRPNEAGLVGGAADEYTFTKRLWFPYKKLVKFGPADAATTHNDDDVYLFVMAYDAFGSLITDIVGYVQTEYSLHYRDP